MGRKTECYKNVNSPPRLFSKVTVNTNKFSRVFAKLD